MQVATMILGPGVNPSKPRLKLVADEDAKIGLLYNYLLHIYFQESEWYYKVYSNSIHIITQRQSISLYTDA